MRDTRFSLALLPACMAVLALSLPAQSITEATVEIGGPGAVGTEGGDPPTLTGGAVATGTLTYRYDSSTGLLDVTVTNTSPVVPGEPNPVINRIYFNLPYLAVTGAKLVEQTFSGDCGIPLRAKVDGNTLRRPHRVWSRGFGRLNVKLSANWWVRGAIANPDASSWPIRTSNLNMGPVTFTFQLKGPYLDRLTATTFATTPSVTPPGEVSRGVFRFQGDWKCGRNSASIGTSGECVPGLWYVGDSCLGETITFVRASAPGCHGCLLVSFDPTPTVISGISVPLSPPYIVIAPEIADSSLDPLEILIPNRPELIGLTGYFAYAVLDPVMGPVVSEVVAVRVCE